MSILFERVKICNSGSLCWIPLQFQNIILNLFMMGGGGKIEFKL